MNEIKPLSLEKLAELEHEQWVEWSKNIAKTEHISKKRLQRWDKLWVDYWGLTEKEKEQDRKYARKVLSHIKSACKFYLKYKNDPNSFVDRYADAIGLSQRTIDLINELEKMATEYRVNDHPIGSIIHKNIFGATIDLDKLSKRIDKKTQELFKLLLEELNVNFNNLAEYNDWLLNFAFKQALKDDENE